MLIEFEMHKRAVQLALTILKKALKPLSTTSVVIKNQVKRKFEALNRFFHSYKNTYFGREPVNTGLAATNAMFGDLTEKYYKIGGRVDDLIEPPPTEPACPTRPWSSKKDSR